MTEEGRLKAVREAALASWRSNLLLSVAAIKTQQHQTTPHFPNQLWMSKCLLMALIAH